MKLDRRVEKLEDAVIERRITEIFNRLEPRGLQASWTAMMNPAHGLGLPSEELRDLAADVDLALFERAGPMLRELLWNETQRRALEAGRSLIEELLIDPELPDPLHRRSGLNLSELLCDAGEYESEGRR